MRRWQKLMCLVVVFTLLLSIVCISSSADSYVYDDVDGNFFTSAGRDFMGLPFHLSVDMGRGYFLNMDNYGSTLYEHDDIDVSPSIVNSNRFSLYPNEYSGVRSLLTANLVSTDGSTFSGVTSFILSNSVYNAQLNYRLFSSGEEAVLDELFDLEKINSPSTLSGGGVPTFSYDGVISSYHLRGDNYFGRLPSYLNYDLLINEDYLPIDNNWLDTTTALGIQNFRIYVSCDVLSVDENYRLVSTPFSRSWVANPSMSTDYVRVGFSSGVSRYLALNYYNQGANVNAVSCRFNLRRVYHLIGDRFPDSYIKNMKFYIEPLDTLDDGSSSSSPLWNVPFINSFSSIGIPTPCLGFSLEYSPISVGFNYDDYYDNFYNWLIDSGERVTVINEQVSLNDFNLVDWLGDTLNGVFNAPIIGPITLATILYVVAGLGIVFIVLKIFFGG